MRLKVALEPLERAPTPTAVELVLDVAEDPLDCAVADAPALARHALRKPALPESRNVGVVLVLSAHVRAPRRRRALGLGRREHGEHLLLLSKVRARGYRVHHDPLAAEVAAPREMEPTEEEPDPPARDISARLLPRAVRREDAAEYVLERLPNDPFFRAVPAMAGLLRISHPRPISPIILSTVLPSLRTPSTSRSSIAICR